MSRPGVCRRRTSCGRWWTEAHERFKANRDGQSPTSILRWPRFSPISSASAWSASPARLTRAATPIAPFSIMSVSKPFVFALVCAGSGRGSRAPAPRRQRDRPAVQRARRDRAQRRRADQSDGQFGRDRDDQPRARVDGRGTMAVHPRRPVAIRRPRARDQRRRLRFRGEWQFTQPGDRPIASRVTDLSPSTPPTPSTSTRGNARST